MSPTKLDNDQALLDALVSTKVIPPEGVAAARASGTTGAALEDYLVSTTRISETDLARAKATVSGLPYQEISGDRVDPEVVKIIPRAVADRHQAVAFARKGSEVHIGLTNPGDYQAIEALEFLAGEAHLSFHYFVITPSAFHEAMSQYEAVGKEVARALEVAKEKFTPKAKAKTEVSEETLKGAPVSRMVQVIMRDAVLRGASDIHIEPHGKETRVRYRVDGVLRTVLTLPGYIHPALVSRVKVLARLKLDETRVPQDGRIGESIDGKQIDYRISTLPLLETEKVVMRILDTTQGVPTLQMLGFRPEHVAAIEQEIKRPYGMLLVSGPTGSGKSTTLYAILNMLNAEGVNIVTLEDPIEYYLRGVNQSQVRPEIGYTFATGLRSLLRQDPNVIMVGEIRDRETAELAIHASLTGHLLFSTIHTNDAFGVATRLIDMGAEGFLIAATLNTAVSQRLARRICGNCRVSVAIPAKLVERVGATLAAIPAKYFGADLNQKNPEFFKGQGCDACARSGYQGRVGVAEVLQITSEMKQLISEHYTPEEAVKLAAKQGMITLFQDGLLKSMNGLTTLEEVMRIAEE